MKKQLPQLKKKINAFLVGEEGKISKQALLSTGSLLSGAALGSLLAAKNVAAGHTDSYDPSCDGCEAPSNDQCHVNSLDVDYAGGTGKGTHAHCIETHENVDSGGDCGDDLGLCVIQVTMGAVVIVAVPGTGY